MKTVRLVRTAAWGTVLLSGLVWSCGAWLQATRPSHAPVDTLGFLVPLALLSFSVVGAVIASRHPRNTTGWILLGIGLIAPVSIVATDYAVRALSEAPGSLPGGGVATWLTSWLYAPMLGLIVLLPLVFPNGRLLSRRWLPVVGALTLFVLLASIGNGFSAQPPIDGHPEIRNPLALPAAESQLSLLRAVGFAAVLIAMAGAIVSMLMRYRRAGDEQRHQLKWFLYAACLAPTPFILYAFNTFLSEATVVLILPLLPVSIGIAILRYRLYDIDLVINKTLVYGALAALITAVYVAIVVGAGTLLGSGGRPNLALSVLATAVVAVAFQPVRERLQRLANRLVYGKRATPYEVLAALTHRLAAALSAEEVLPRLAEAAARGVGATSCRMRLLVPGGGERVVTWPDGASTGALEHVFTVAEHGVELGSIEIGKPAGESLRPSDRALLADVAAQAGLIFRNVRLTMELQQHLQEISAQAEQLRSSRQRIVAAAHEQRGRIEREIRSGPQAQLEQLEERLQQADGLIERDPGRAAALLSDLAAQANQTLNALRDLARGIFPALLVDQGLVPALEAHTRKQDVRLELDPTLNGLRFNAAVEAAVYFSCVGALQNAAAAPKKIHLAAHAGRLEFVAPLPKSGTLQDIRDRVEALGGSLRPCGETIEGSVPVAVEAIAAGVQ